MYWRIGKTTVKTLLMEVLALSTPTSSGNYKVFLETLQDERGIDIACRAPLEITSAGCGSSDQP